VINPVQRNYTGAQGEKQDIAGQILILHYNKEQIQVSGGMIWL